MNRDEFIFFLYALEELLKSNNNEGALRVVEKAIKQSESEKKDWIKGGFKLPFTINNYFLLNFYEFMFLQPV